MKNKINNNMSIKHKFHSTDFGNGFKTENAILKTPYQPEVMFLGTFNPDTPNTNFADFFYGRNYFWPAFMNIFKHTEYVKSKTKGKRIPSNTKVQKELDPSLSKILEICRMLKITFADFILEVLNNNEPDYRLLFYDNVLYKGFEYNLIQDGKNGSIGGLQQLNTLKQVNWNTQNIIDYLCENPQIKTIYLTRQPTSIWGIQWQILLRHKCMEDRTLTNIYTPSGQGLVGKPRIEHLVKHWLFNDNPNFGKLDTKWVRSKGVDINMFKDDSDE